MIERVRLKNFKSVERCDVTLRPFTVLVGRNGAGKSNFIDALVFVAESLRAPLPDPIARRGSFRDMTYQRRGGAIDIEIGFRTQDGVAGEFGVQLERGEVRQESLLLSNGARYSRTGRAASVWIDDKGSATAIASDGLALGPLATFEQFRGAFQALASVHAYRRLDPEAMRSPQEPYAADRLSSDGSNLTRVWARLYKEEPESIGRVTDYLAAIAPGVRSIVPVRIDTYDVLRFHQAFGDGEISLPASSMSDGTLRALAILVASRTPSSAVVVEEPETA
ncbi:MAG TPA: AAA family ATPase, partial [Thermoanaerobaculia bacterium]|nr:AAA family ATPase [Thermoanaerobaculia bacterium]